MSKRIEIVSSFYNEVNEDERLNRNRCGQLEYATTMEYIHRYAKPGAKLLEIGAGTGRYSIALAKEGYEVKVVNIEDVTTDSVIYDIGTKTIEVYSEILRKAKTVFVNGTMGLYEDEQYRAGTENLYKVLSSRVNVGANCVRP